MGEHDLVVHRVVFAGIPVFIGVMRQVEIGHPRGIDQEADIRNDDVDGSVRPRQVEQIFDRPDYAIGVFEHVGGYYEIETSLQRRRHGIVDREPVLDGIRPEQIARVDIGIDRRRIAEQLGRKTSGADLDAAARSHFIDRYWLVVSVRPKIRGSAWPARSKCARSAAGSRVIRSRLCVR
ncbi:MAG: hypothetical protein WDN69_08305 [Aliidongia sp.]